MIVLTLLLIILITYRDRFQHGMARIPAIDAVERQRKPHIVCSYRQSFSDISDPLRYSFVQSFVLEVCFSALVNMQPVIDIPSRQQEESRIVVKWLSRLHDSIRNEPGNRPEGDPGFCQGRTQ